MKFDCLAVTGGMGSGKSTVLKLFEEKGYTVISADSVAHELLTSASPYYLEYAKEIDSWLGTSYQTESEIVRLSFRKQLNATINGFEIVGKISMPYILKSMYDKYQQQTSIKKSVIFEVPLLVEHHLQSYFSKILVVTCDLTIRVERLKDRNPDMSEEEIYHRISIQSSDKEKMDIADYIIDNSNDTNSLKNQFEQLYNEFSQTSFSHLIHNV